MTRKLPEIQCGKVKRKTFSKIKEAIELPYLVKIQKDSYDAFIKDGISEVFEDFSPITDYSDHFELYFLDHNLDGAPKYDEKERLCRINRAIVNAGIELYSVSRKENKRLEDVFIEMTGGEGGVQID